MKNDKNEDVPIVDKSGKFVKEIIALGGDINKFTTKSTIKYLKEKYV